MHSIGNSVSAHSIRYLHEEKQQQPLSATRSSSKSEFNINPVSLYRVRSLYDICKTYLGQTAPQISSPPHAIIHQPYRGQTTMLTGMPLDGKTRHPRGNVVRSKSPGQPYDPFMPDMDDMSSDSQSSLSSYSNNQGSYAYTSHSNLQLLNLTMDPDSRDELTVIDGQTVVKDSNVDPILCRLKRQQVVNCTRRKESSVGTSSLEAERVRFSRIVSVREIQEEELGELVSWMMACCLCCCCECECAACRRKQPRGKQLGPDDGILMKNRRSYTIDRSVELRDSEDDDFNDIASTSL